MLRSLKVPGLLAAACLGLACGDDGGGDMNPPAESVSDGTTDLSALVNLAIGPGSGVHGIASDKLADHWSVQYTRFLVSVGSFTFTAADGSSVSYEQDGVIDLLQWEGAKFLGSITVPLTATRIGFSLPVATGRSSVIEPTTAEDLELMTKGGYSIYIEGSITRKDGKTCFGDAPRLCTPAPEIEFAWGFPLDLTIAGCPELDLEADAQVPQTLSMSGERWLWTDFRSDAQTVGGGATLRAQWIANADLDRNGETTVDELGRAPAPGLFRSDYGYDISKAPAPIASARDFVEAQIRMMARDALGDGCKTATAQ